MSKGQSLKDVNLGQELYLQPQETSPSGNLVNMIHVQHCTSQQASASALPYKFSPSLFIYYRPRSLAKQGDNAIGSIFPSVCFRNQLPLFVKDYSHQTNLAPFIPVFKVHFACKWRHTSYI